MYTKVINKLPASILVLNWCIAFIGVSIERPIISTNRTILSGVIIEAILNKIFLRNFFADISQCRQVVSEFAGVASNPTLNGLVGVDAVFHSAGHGHASVRSGGHVVAIGANLASCRVGCDAVGCVDFLAPTSPFVEDIFVATVALVCARLAGVAVVAAVAAEPF